MIEIVNKENCSGCTACASSCPNHCISMEKDSEGFLYPKVNLNKCINCNICEKTCPVLNRNILDNVKKPKTYAVRTKDNLLLQECTSGGFYTTIAKKIVQKKGVAIGAVYDEDFNIIHKIIDEENDIIYLAGSKYVQSYLGDIFKLIKQELNTRKNILFCGTPCQVAGLKNYLKKEYENLLTVDLVCHGVTSPKIWEKYLEYIRLKFGDIKYVNFRSKYLGYHISTMEERFDNGKRQIGSARTNIMSKIFFSNIADRPICYECPFKSINRGSDLTLYDCWHWEKLISTGKDDDKGYTNVIVHSDKGQKLLDEYSDEFHIYEVDTTLALKLDGKMATNAVKKNIARERFYKDLDHDNLDTIISKYLPIRLQDYIIDFMKIAFKRIGMINLLNRIKGKAFNEFNN